MAQHWTFSTTLALICAFFAFQAEHPLALQVKQRRSFKPRFLVWGGVYGGIASLIAFYLLLQSPLLIWIYLGGFLALFIDILSVWKRKQKSIFNEFIVFGAICLSTPFAYLATTGTFITILMGLWLLNPLFFATTIFTVKLRKPNPPKLISSVIYLAIALLLILGLCGINCLSLGTALAFVVAVLKISFILWQKEWYCTTKIQQIAFLETTSALIFLLIAAFSLLPAHL